MREAALKRLTRQRNIQVAFRCMVNIFRRPLDLTQGVVVGDEMKERDEDDLDALSVKTFYERVFENRRLLHSRNNYDTGLLLSRQTNMDRLLDAFVLSRASILLAGGNRAQHWHGPPSDAELYSIQGSFEDVEEKKKYFLKNGEVYQGMVFRLGPWREVTAKMNSLSSSQLAPEGVDVKNWRTLGVAAGAEMSDVFAPRWYCAKLRGDPPDEASNNFIFAGDAGAPRDVLACCCFSRKDPAAVRLAAIAGKNTASLLYMD